jgi:hypothetical protein
MTRVISCNECVRRTVTSLETSSVSYFPTTEIEQSA